MAAHVCKQEGAIGAMQAKLDAQAEADSRIENNLKELVAAVQANQSTNASHFAEIGNNFVKIETILAEQKKASDASVHTQQEIVASLHSLSGRVDSIESRVAFTEKDITEMKQVDTDHNDRLKKIEKWIIKAAAIIGVLIGLLEIGANLDSIKAAIFPELKQLNQEQVQQVNEGR